MNSSRSIGLTILALVSLAFSACSKAPPLDRPVSAQSAEDFGNWRRDAEGELTQVERQDLEIALQELKIQVMTSTNLGTSSAREEKVHGLIHQKPLREVLVLGWQARRDRFELERGYLQEKYDHDRGLKTREGDTESARYLENVVRTEGDRIEKLKGDIAVAEGKIRSWGAEPKPFVPPTPTPTPAPAASPAPPL